MKKEMNTIIGMLVAMMISCCAWAEDVATPSLFQKNNAQPIEITADKLAVDQPANTASFSGNVIAIQGDTHLKAQKMIVHYVTATNSQLDQKKNAISRIDVYEQVFINTPLETAQGDEGFYDLDKQLIHLKGNVILTKGKNIVRGTHMVYDVAKGKSQLVGESTKPNAGKGSGRVKGVFVPNN